MNDIDTVERALDDLIKGAREHGHPAHAKRPISECDGCMKRRATVLDLFERREALWRREIAKTTADLVTELSSLRSTALTRDEAEWVLNQEILIPDRFQDKPSFEMASGIYAKLKALSSLRSSSLGEQTD